MYARGPQTKSKKGFPLVVFRNADQLEEAEILKTDVCIVGAGAAGITLALELEKSRYRVMMLESGDAGPLQAADQLNELEIAGHPLNISVPMRRRAFGGSTIATYGRAVLLDSIEFEARPWVSDQAWPFNLLELQRWYPRAAAVLALAQPELLDADFWSQQPLARMARGYGLSTRVHRWGKHINLGKAWKKHFHNSENVEVLLRATAVSCDAGPGRGRIKQLSCRALGGGHFSVRARVFVLATGGLENPRLLLLSKHGTNAPAINWDPVGRYYMNHPRSETLAKIQLGSAEKGKNAGSDVPALKSLLMHRQRKLAGRLQFALSPGEDLQRNEGLLNVSSFFFAVSDLKARDALQQLTQVRTAWSQGKLQGTWQAGGLVRHLPILVAGAIQRLRLQPYRAGHLVVVDQCEQRPDRESRVLLGQGFDRFGCPKLKLDWRIGPDTTRSLRRSHELMARFFEESGIGRFESKLLDDPDFEPAYQDCAHPTGTTRMSELDKDGVVDSDCRVHGQENLFVAGSSVFPAGGHASPTFTIISLAARLADRLKRGLPGKTQ